MMANLQAYHMIKAESKRLGLPKFYKEDLTKHDLNVLRCKDSEQSFVWVVRECGTHIWFYKKDEKQKEFSVSWAKAVLNQHPNAHVYLFLFGPNTLTKISHDAAIRFLKGV
jgi:hypothetical protein